MQCELRPVGSIAVIFCVIAVSSTIVSADELGTPSSLAAATPGQQHEYYSNCGINVAYVGLQLCGKYASIDDVARLTNAGQFHDRSCSLVDLKRAFEARDLKVKAMKASAPEMLFDLAQPDVILVTRLVSRTSGKAHFNLLLGAEDRVIVVDPPLAPRAIRRDSVRSDPMVADVTGEFLLISRALSAIQGPSLVLEHREIDLGKIPPTQTLIEAEIPIRNVGQQNLKIVKVKGTCGCFQDSRGDTDVPPGSTGKIIAILNRQRIPAGETESRVKIETNDPNNKELTVTLKFLLETPEKGAELRLSPKLVAFGRVSQAELKTRKFRIHLAVPAKAASSSATVKATGSTHNLRIDKISNTNDDNNRAVGVDERTFDYEVSWLEPPSEGIFREEISITISDQNRKDQTLKVSIFGDVQKD